MTDIQKAIQEARPKLSVVDPKSFLISWAFVIFNAAIGIYFFNTNVSELRVPGVTGITNNYFWGAVFIFVGFWLMVALLKNDWPAIRRAMIMGLLVKLFWSYALVVVAIQAGLLRTLASMAMWFFISAVQAIVVVHFLPKDIARVGSNGRSDK